MKIVPTPIGQLLLVGNGSALTELLLPGSWSMRDPDVRSDALLDEAAHQLAHYFAGERRDFELRLAPVGTTFQQRVWRALREIPFGRTMSYSELAALIDAPGAARAVGLANGRNPIAIVIPCHRVIGAGGDLVGYGGGLDRKRWLLGFEAGVGEPQLPLFDGGQQAVRNEQQLARANHGRGQHARREQIVNRRAEARGDLLQGVTRLNAVQPA
jgi:methylated-DNA-[protein]-cysteine S-methyltransferase